jgi:flagellar biosynthesis chaperone FliJ
MKKFATRLLALMVLISMLVNASFSQSSATSTDRAELVSLCEKAKDEAKVSRTLIAQYEETLNAREKELEQAKLVQGLSDEKISLLETEVSQLRKALAKERDDLAEKELAIDAYKKALSKMTKKKNFFKTLTKIFAVTTLVTGAAAAVLILKED